MNIFTMTQNNAVSSVFSGFNRIGQDGLYYSSQFYGHYNASVQFCHTRLFDAGMHRSFHESFGSYIDDYKYKNPNTKIESWRNYHDNFEENMYFYYLGGGRPHGTGEHIGHFYEDWTDKKKGN